MSTATLDRQQRVVLRKEIEVCAHQLELADGFRAGDRRYVRRCATQLRRLIELMEAIGWSERPRGTG